MSPQRENKFFEEIAWKRKIKYRKWVPVPWCGIGCTENICTKTGCKNDGGSRFPFCEHEKPPFLHYKNKNNVIGICLDTVIFGISIKLSTCKRAFLYECACDLPIFVLLPPCTVTRKLKLSFAASILLSRFHLHLEQTAQPWWGFASQGCESPCSEIKAITGYRCHLLCSLTEDLQPVAQLLLQSAGKKISNKSL